ncbi:DEAD/DEAH box helicase [Gordonia sp. MMO-8]|uniref:DEAD/DEAH box helicase n=1 Tax=Gordonia sp. MMO-8 TaxID=3127886 RepID=UPI00301B0A61
MTATLERSDDGVEGMLLPYFTTKIVGCDFARAKSDEIIAPVRVMTVPVSLSALDFGRYQECGDVLSKERWILTTQHGCSAEPFGSFMNDVQELTNSGSPAAAWSARRYLQSFAERRAILAKSPAKMKLLAELGAVLVGGCRTIVFSETVESAVAAEHALAGAGVLADTMTGELSQDERRARLKRFESGAITALAAPKLLDEGIDVAEADVGVIVAASASKRQMIQRIGRIIRLKKDGRAATFVILYVQGTIEDPAQGAHESFLEQLTAIADEQIDVPAAEAVSQLARWLNQSSEQVEAARTMPRAHALRTIVNRGDVVDPVRDGIAARLLMDPKVAENVAIFDQVLACMTMLTQKQVQVLATRFGIGHRERASVREAGTRLGMAPRDVVRRSGASKALTLRRFWPRLLVTDDDRNTCRPLAVRFASIGSLYPSL